MDSTQIKKRNKETLDFRSSFQASLSSQELNIENLISLKRQHSYFGYVDIQIEGVRPFVLFTGNDDLLALSFFWYGEQYFESMSVKIWASLSQDSKCIFDVGAYVGIYSLIAAHINNNKDLNIFSFEPSRLPYARLAQNISINRCSKKIHIIGKGMSDNSGVLMLNQIRTPGTLSTGASLVEKDNKPTTFKDPVNVLKGDDFVKEKNITQLDLVKIDVEEAEVEVIKGLIGTLKTQEPVILLEVSSNTYFNARKLLISLGYELHYINEGESTIHKLSDSCQVTYVNNILCVPKSKIKQTLSKLEPLNILL